MKPGGLWARRPGVIALMLGAVSATGFAPLGLWPVTLICLAGLLAVLSRVDTARRAFTTGYAFGVGQFTCGLNWIAHAFTFQEAMPHWLGYPAVSVLALYLAVYPAMATAIGWRLAKGVPQALVILMAAAWLLTEYLRATMFTGFAWNPLGVIWLDTGVQDAAPVLGTYGLGAVAMLAAGALWLIVAARRRWAMIILLPIAAVALIGLTTTRPPAAGGPMIAVIQPNMGLRERDHPDFEERNFARLASLSRIEDRRPHLLFWPEAALPAILDMEPRWRQRVASLLRPGDVLMTGGDKFHMRPTDKPYYEPGDLLGANNSLWVVADDGRLIGRYDKAHLVPYGEYLPMRPVLSAIGLSRIVPGSVDFWPGPGPRTLDLPAAAGRPPLRMAVQICYEIVFSGQLVDRANRPHFLFNPSNDAWFGSWGPPQHLAQARLRAVEEGLPVIRSTPTGISAVIGADGRIVASMPLGRAGTIATSLPAALPPTPFARAGNVLPLLLAGLLLLGGVALAGSRR